MKQIKDFITGDKPIIITVKSKSGGPPGDEEYKVYAVCRAAQDFVSSLDRFFRQNSFSGYELEYFNLDINNNPYIPAEVQLDIDIEDGSMANLANVFAMTVEQLAQASENENNFSGWSEDIKKDSEIFGEYYDPSVRVTIQLKKSSEYYCVIKCYQLPFNEIDHNKKVVERFKSSRKSIDDPY